MEDLPLQNMWEAYDRKLAESKVLNLQSWALNRQAFEMMQTQKAQSRLNRLATFKARAVVLGIIWAAFLCFLVFYKISWQGIFFNISMGMIALFTILAIVTYIKHIILIRQIDESGSVVETQQKLAALQSSTIRIVRILWLQMPFYTTFFLTPAMFVYGGITVWVITIAVTGFFTFAAVWLYKNINYSNRHKKWFKMLFGSIEWTAVIKAMEYLEEVEKFKQEG